MQSSRCQALTCNSGLQVHRAVNEMLSDASGPDKMVVVMDARGASALQATRHVKLFKDVAVCLNQVRLQAGHWACMPEGLQTLKLCWSFSPEML